MSTRKAGAVLVDMDGTLLDTAPDMAAALNVLRAEEHLAAIDYDRVRPHVSHGSLAVVKLGFPDADAERFEQLRQRFLEIYRQNLSVQTRPFEGFDTVLATLARAGVPWGIVTNKPAWLAEPLMSELALANPPGCIVSGDTLPERKPHPRPLLFAAEELGVDPTDCLYLGDARRDIEAALAAGMIALGASFGYLGPEDEPATWGAEAWIDSPLQLLDWVRIEAGVHV